MFPWVIIWSHFSLTKCILASACGLLVARWLYVAWICSTGPSWFCRARSQSCEQTHTHMNYTYELHTWTKLLPLASNMWTLTTTIISMTEWSASDLQSLDACYFPAPSNALVVSLSTNLHPWCSVLVGFRDGFDCSDLNKLNCFFHNQSKINSFWLTEYFPTITLFDYLYLYLQLVVCGLSPW